MKSLRLGIVLTLLYLPAISFAVAQQGGASDSENHVQQLDQHRFGPNVVVTIVIGDVADPADRRSYRLIARDRGPRARLIIGWRMPIPTSQSEDPNDDGTISYIYQNVGVTASIRVEVLEDGRVLLEGEIEASGSREGKPVQGSGEAPPIIGTFQQALSILLNENEPMRVAEVPDPEDGRLFVQLEVDVQD